MSYEKYEIRTKKVYYNNPKELQRELSRIPGNVTSFKTTDPDMTTDKNCVEVTYKQAIS